MMDPRHLHRVRRKAAENVAREHVTKTFGPPTTPEEQNRFDDEVRKLVAEWTAGWEGPEPVVANAAVLRRGWWRRRRKDA
jgi:hypothetical protein